MSIAEIASRKPQFAARKVGGELMLVPLKGSVAEMDEMFTLNETGSVIYESISEDSTEESLTQALMAEFDIDRATAAADVRAFLTSLAAAIGS